MVSAVKICKQCVQTALASGVLSHRHLDYSPQMKTPGAL